MHRRQFLWGSAAGVGLAFARPSFANTPDRPLLVVMVLRGGLDGLAAVPPVGDPRYSEIRSSLALHKSVALDGTFGLHPALEPLHALYTKKELLVVHATATPYRDRSHFDGQNVLESGGNRPYELPDGWLLRALGATNAMALGGQVPLLLSGEIQVRSGNPQRPACVSDRLLAAVMGANASDAQLTATLVAADETRELLARYPARGRSTEALARSVAGLLRDAAGPSVITMDVGSWDTHAGQVGALERGLPQLAAAITGLRTDLGDRWKQTVVAVVSEFGRTARPNGTGGTDHGTGGIALLAGGAVRGGKVLADWPSLDPSALLDGRDLLPTLDTREVLAGVLHDHLEVPAQHLVDRVFPGVQRIRQDLVQRLT